MTTATTSALAALTGLLVVGGAAFAQSPSSPPARSTSARAGSAPRQVLRLGPAPAVRVTGVENVTFDIVPRAGSTNTCPVLVQVSDKKDRDLEGRVVGRDWVGDASLGWFASPFWLVMASQRRAVWEAALLPRYQGCQADGRMAWRNGDRIPAERAYLFLELRDTRVRLLLDLSTRPPDARISLHTVTDGGEPRWVWRPSDAAAR